jgi:hypothetical protein
MAQTNFTPIQLYSSATASAVPLAANLAAGELAINTLDGKLYYKNSGGVVTLLASTAGASGDVVGPASATDKAIATFDGTTGKLIQNNSGVTITAGILTATGFSGPLNGTVGATTPAAGTFTSLSDSGNLTFTGTGNRITGDMTNATVANRVYFQTSTTNGNTVLGVIPNGSATAGVLQLYGNSDPTNTSLAQITASTGAGLVSFISGVSGTGTLLPMVFTVNTERVRIDTAGLVGVGTASATSMLQTAGSTSVSAFKTPNIAEVDTISATAATGTINFDITTQSVLFYTSNASGNWTVNFRGSSGTTLNAVMQTGESISATFLVTQGATAYYNSAVTIDGTSVTPKWQGGTAPTSGNASSVDCYTYVIQKTGSATYVVLASQTKFA